MFAASDKSSSLIKVQLYQWCCLQPLMKLLNSNSNTISMSPRLCGFPSDPHMRCGRTQNNQKNESNSSLACKEKGVGGRCLLTVVEY